MRPTHSVPLHQFVTFRLDGELYGLAIQVVKEVNPTTAINPVPLSNPTIRGVVNIRGQIVLVMDIAVIFGRPARPIGPESQLVILKTAPELGMIRGLDAGTDVARFGSKPICFLVDSIGEVVSVPAQSMEAPPPHLSVCNAVFVRGIVHSGDDLLVVLDAASLLTDR
jgi:purine-binding chemotaxis protein CheW